MRMRFSTDWQEETLSRWGSLYRHPKSPWSKLHPLWACVKRTRPPQMMGNMVSESSPLLDPRLTPFIDVAASHLATGLPRTPRLLFGEVDISLGAQVESVTNGL